MLTAGLLLAAAVANAVTNGGEVAYVTAGTAYLDVGANDGLNRGQKLKLVRGKRAVGSCEVVQVSATRALCTGARAQSGDRFSFPVVSVPGTGKADKNKKGPATQRKTLPSEAQLASLRVLVEQAPIEKVVHQRTSSAFSLRGSTTLRQEVWGITTTPGGVFGRSSLDASARAGLGLPNVFAQASLRVLGDLVAPPEQRFRPGELVELYVWGASVGVSDGLVVGEVGRFYARKVPGALLLDGAQAGVRFFGGTTEVGAYGGMIPELRTLAPGFGRLTAGAYVASDVNAADGVMVMPRARLGVVSAPDFATMRGELEAQTQVSWRNVGALATSVRAGLGGAADLLPSLDAVSLDADVVALPSVRVSGGYRYFGGSPVDFDVIAQAPPIGGAHHAQAGARWEALTDLRVGLVSGLGFDNLSAAFRGFLGPELELPRAFGALGGLGVGYLEEFGSSAGRSAWVATSLGFLPVLSLTARASYFATAPFEAAVGDSFREIGLMTLLDAPILPGLSLRGRAYAQQALPDVHGSARAAPTTLLVDLAATGTL